MSPSLVVAAFAALAVILPRAASAIDVSDVEGIEDTVFKNITATGADSIFLDDGELVLIYSNATDSAELYIPGYAQANILAVGGGGAGGSGVNSPFFGSGGGGGAGGFIETNSVTLLPDTYKITVGAGGAAPASASSPTVGANGGDSSISGTERVICVAYGGGGGGARSNGNAGGSGGGCSRNGSTALSGGAATQPTSIYGGLGNAGGNSGKVNLAGAGGGGAGSAAADVEAAYIATAGGSGVSSAITGSTMWFAAGGGGGSMSGNANTSPGAGGMGGDIAIGGTGAGDSAASAGMNGRGCGGGGGNNAFVGGAGGDGAVIIRITTSTLGPLEKPEAKEFVYDGTEKSVYDANDYVYTIAEGSTLAATDAGEYTLTVTPNDGFYWGSDSSDTASVSITWKITKAQNEITGLSIADWKEGNPQSPTCTAKFGTPVYWYSVSADGTYSTVKPTTAGTYYLKATVEGNNNYYSVETAPISFTILPAGSSPVSSLAYFTTITFDKYTGEALENFPVLVKLEDNVPLGFHYYQMSEDGSDLRFCNDYGELYPHEVEEWNPGGVSYVWVKVPEYKQDASMVMCWGKVAGATLPEVTISDIWSDYVGVWHFAEDSGTAYDSTVNKLNGTPKGTRTSEMVGVEGVIGKARVNYVADTYSSTVKSYIQVPDYDSHNVGGVFTISGWFKAKDIKAYHRLFSRRNGANDNDGWEAEVNNGDKKGIKFRGAGGYGTDVTVTVPDLTADWVYIAAVYNNTTLKVYANGVLSTSGTIVTATDNGLPLSFGNDSNGDEASWFGWYDEIRLTKQVRSADWIKADYDQSFGVNALNSFDAVGKTKGKKVVNHWAEIPAISASWNVGEIPAEYTIGRDSVGATPTVVFRNIETGEESDTLPERFGRYEATFTIEDSEAATGLSVTLNFEIIGNYWVEEPAISATVIQEGTTATVSNFGKDLAGRAGQMKYRSVSSWDTVITNELPKAAGSYEVTFFVEEEGVFDSLECVLYFTVTGDSSYGDTITGPSGRILLMNRDVGDADHPAVDYQGYFDNASRYSDRETFWEYVNGDAISSYNLKAGTEFKLWTANYGKVLWHLTDCRHGNIFPTSNTADLLALCNYLPWSATSKRITVHNDILSIVRNEVGWCVMRNTLNAAVYSSCFEDGVGTVYFDAVNAGSTSDGSNFKLVVEVATDCLDDSGNVVDLPPTDENVHKVTETWDVDDSNPQNITSNLVSAVTNMYAYANWRPVPVIALKRDYTAAEYTANPNLPFVAEPAQLTNALAIANGGTINNFYRMIAKVNCEKPARFRISRVSTNTGVGEDIVTALIILDNIIASYPAMRVDMGSYGFYDEAKKGKFTLGQEMAWNTPFPDVDGEIYARGKPEYYTNAGDTDADTSKFVISAKLNYRWRYLGQKLNPEEGWNSVYLNPNDNFKALEPLKLPGIHGDVEYWYELALNAPFYEYVDYSGSNLGLGGFYSEAVAAVTNRRDSALGTLPSQGTDWFVRLREGESDYQSAEVVIRRGDSGKEERIPMTVVADHVWRGLLPTATNKASTISYRLEFRNKQEPGSTEFAQNTNCWYSVYDFAQTPVSDILSEGTTSNWTKLNVDASTGYLMFQIDESTRALTIVHADYQNFNAWTDAQGDKFVGNKVEDNLKTGTSPRKQDFYESFDNWEVMPDSNANWKLFRFPDINDLYGRHPYVPFASDVDQNWQIGPGMWVSKAYRDNTEDKGVALQMEGCGKGFVQYTDAADAPRGLESISFNARIGQYLQFDDFSYYAGDVIMKMTNYTFATRCAFDLNENKDFRGNASLSIVAYYIPGKGCYEARWEQIEADWDKDGNLKGPKAKSQKLSLYRWTQSSGKMTAELLDEYVNDDFNMPAAKSDIKTASFLPVFISVTNLNSTTTRVLVGVKSNGLTLDAVDASFGTGSDWYAICHDDNTSKRHKAGTYGLLTANCPGVLGRPQYFDYYVGGTITKGKHEKQEISGFAGFKDCYTDIEDELWIDAPGRMQYVKHDSDNRYNYLVAAPVSQELNVYTASAGKTDWSLLFTTNLTGFGSVSASGTVHYPLYTTKDCSVRIAVGGQWDDPRNDVIIDTVELKQWRGDDYAVNADGCVKGWENPYSGSMTNFVFTSCWIQEGATPDDRTLLMSAKRVHTNNSDVCSIRSPVMDGYRFSSGAQRGKGLGMISVSYRNAQANTRLLVQVATNNFNRTYLAEYDAISPSRWVTVTNWNFAAELKNKRDSGILSCYVGIHDVSGLMRVIIDPELVEEVKGETDTAKFGEIEIVDIFCRDEPALDSLCWWGWNLRTIGAVDSADAEGRMYLSDLTDSTVDLGMSLALNNSVTEDIAYVTDHDKADIKKEKPFLQTPYFGTNIVGEISFKARQYIADNAEPSSVVLYGSYKGSQTEEWTKLKEFVVTNPTYQAYTYKTEPGQEYAAFRLAVTGVEGVQGAGAIVPDTNTEAQRVLIDEVLVSEAVRARMAFRSVGAFRSNMNGTGFVPNVPSKAEQPLCNEGWGVQCEIYAAQLASDINFDIAPTVIFHWYEGISPWGYENWKGRSKAQGRHSAVLARATGTNLIYRSSQITSPEAIVGMSTTPGSIVQYMLEVRYYAKESMKQMTNFLAATEWRRPDWYHPVDYNRDYGKNKNFAAYNILDTIAPGWAWINEVNILGSYKGGYNSDDDCQYVELAVPYGSDITGWKVRLLDPNARSRYVVTNTIAQFGTSELPGLKSGTFAYSNFVFPVIGNRKAMESGKLKKSDGSLDAVWDFTEYSGTFMSSGSINPVQPVAIQLMRPSGIVEHEVMVMGTNYYGTIVGWEKEYDPQLSVDYLKEVSPGSHVFYAGSDDIGDTVSLGVFSARGENATLWNNVMLKTPGRPNENQTIDPDFPTPNGETIIIYANVDNVFGKILQKIDGEWTNTVQTLYIKRGSERGTNILYRVDPWFELGSVTTNNVNIPVPAPNAMREYSVNVGKGVSNNFTVIARAALQRNLVEEYGLTPDNRYTPAVVKWLEEGKDMFNNKWANPGSGEIRLADFRSWTTDAVITNLNLTQMYWLDMDPTVGNLSLKGYVSGFVPGTARGDGTYSPTRVSVKMMITNRTDDIASKYYGDAKPPYVLRGLEPGSNSWNYQGGWTSATFKVAGVFRHEWLSSRRNWVDFRWFVFNKNSFTAKDAVDPFKSVIDIKDPFSTDSPGYTAGWYDYAQKYGRPGNVFYLWNLNENYLPITVNTLKQENFYE